MFDEVDISKYYPAFYSPYNVSENVSKTTAKSLRAKLGRLKRKLKLHLKTSFKNFIFKTILHYKSRYIFDKLVLPHITINRPIDTLLKRLYGTRLKKKSRILDVGCGNGFYLDKLYDMGYKNITGIDMFIPDDKIRNTKWTFKKCDIFSIEVDSKYDLIILNHVFEHMFEPDKVLNKITKLLAVDGTCLISIPLVDGLAWKHYLTDYCQIDAPRHIYLYTRKAISNLCEKANLYIDRILLDSHAGVYLGSDGYQKTNKSLLEIFSDWNIYSKEEIDVFREMAKISNLSENGDEAIFYLKKKKR
ncbi:MAG: class I SAM-dependent methyltransferase [Fusobacteriaceae bacterium]|nr:class I SAM-dependent methyltransferase [Fusobacteriaceae bacterium]